MSDPEQSISASPAYGQNLIRDEFKTSMQGKTAGRTPEQLQALGHEPRTGTFTADEARYIYIRGYGKTSATDNKPVLGTSGIIPCLAVAVYNPEQKSGALAHFDTRTNISSLDKMLDDLSNKNQKLEIHLAGGDPQSEHSRQMVESIIDKLNQRENVTVKSADILGNAPMRSLALDTRTGTVYSQFMGTQLDKGENPQAIANHHARTAMEWLPLRPEYIDGQSFLPLEPAAAINHKP